MQTQIICSDEKMGMAHSNKVFGLIQNRGEDAPKFKYSKPKHKKIDRGFLRRIRGKF